MQINVRELRKLRHVLKFAVAEENHGDRREQDMQVRVLQDPQWTGGGVVFAPTPRDYSFKLNKKEKRAALKSALTSRVVENKFVVVDELKLDEIKTKKFVEVLKNLNVEKALVILNDMDEKVIASAANIPTVKTTQTNELNVFDVLKYDTVVVTKAAVATIEEVYA